MLSSAPNCFESSASSKILKLQRAPVDVRMFRWSAKKQLPQAKSARGLRELLFGSPGSRSVFSGFSADRQCCRDPHWPCQHKAFLEHEEGSIDIVGPELDHPETQKGKQTLRSVLDLPNRQLKIAKVK